MWSRPRCPALPRRLAAVLVLLLAALGGGRLDAAVIKVACVGDSITYGSGSSSVSTKSYPAVLQQLLGVSGYQVGNYGRSGATLLKTGDLPYWGTTEYTNSKAFLPDIVVIMLGTNDSKPQNWVNKANFVADYTDLINQYRALASQPIVFCCTPCPVYGAGNFGITDPVVHDEVIPRILTATTARGAPVIDVYPALSGFPTYFPDNVHPNDTGYALLAQTIFAPIHPPVAARSLNAVAVSSARIDLTWSDASDNETGFKLMRGTAIGGPFTLIATTAANVVAYSDIGLAEKTHYFYRVVATNDSGDASTVVAADATTPSLPPDAPSGLTATTTPASSSQVLLAWTDNSYNETGFKIERALALAGPYVLITTTAANVVAYTDDGLAAGTPYFYRVRATGIAGDSAAVLADTTTLALAPTAPASLRATTISSLQVDLTWTDASNNETGFLVERKTGPTGVFVQIATTAADAVTFSDPDVVGGVTYVYRVGAVNGLSAVAYTNEAAAATPGAPLAGSSDSSSGKCGHGSGIVGLLALLALLAASQRLHPLAKGGAGRARG